MKLNSVLFFFFVAFCCSFSLSAKPMQKSVSTNNFAYQYTIDGYLQQVAIYSDSVICTNMEGPRLGLQLIIMNNGAIAGMCESYKLHKDHVSHKYSWCEVKSFPNYQIVKAR